jgi:hypothetical protein
MDYLDPDDPGKIVRKQLEAGLSPREIAIRLLNGLRLGIEGFQDAIPTDHPDLDGDTFRWMTTLGTVVDAGLREIAHDVLAVPQGTPLFDQLMTVREAHLRAQKADEEGVDPNAN